MQWTPALMALRDVLADLYATEQNARRILLDAGVIIKFIEFRGSPVNFWTDTLLLVSNNAQVPDLIQKALSEFPRNRALHAAWQQWLAEQQQEYEPLTSRSQPPTGFPTLAAQPFGTRLDTSQNAMMPQALMTAILSGMMQQMGTQVLSPMQALPTMEALFEIIHDPAEVPAAIFRTQPSRGLAPYDVPHVQGRDGVADIQDAIYDAMMDAGGMVLVQSRAGLGKTREVTELAIRLCDQGWAVGVAKSEGDVALNRLASMPDSLRSERLLLVFDDLHRRTTAGGEQQAPYAERMEALLAYLEEQLGPGRVRVLATGRSEPYQRRQLGFDPSRSPWHRFGLYDLPELTTDGLVEMLVSLAGQVNVEIPDNDAELLVENSDHTLRTLIINVDRARRHEVPLTRATWLPSQGDTWKARFREARGRHPTAPQVFASLTLIRDAGLPTRTVYVARLSKGLAGKDTAAAVDGLVDLGLLGLRRGVLDAFSDEQLVESLRASDMPLPEIANHWADLEQAVAGAAERSAEWLDDLVVLSGQLLRANLNESSETIADLAIEHGRDDADVYYARGLARSNQGNFVLAEPDFTVAIERGRDDADVYWQRGLARVKQDAFAEAEADISAAIQRSMNYATGYHYATRAAARLFQNNYAEAETDLSAAIQRGVNDRYVYYFRGMARRLQGNFPEAEADHTAAIERGLTNPDVYYYRGLLRDMQANYLGSENDLAIAIQLGKGDADVYHYRGIERLFQGKDAEAENDFSTAIERGKDDADVYFRRGVARFNQHNYVEAEFDFAAAIQRGMDDAGVYFFRGRTRLFQENNTEAELDFSAAIQRGQDDTQVYFARGTTRFNQGRFAEAEADFSAAIQLGMNDAYVYFLRGRVWFNRDSYAYAEADFSAAIQLGMDDDDVYFRRGWARLSQGSYGVAEADFSDAIERGKDDATIYFSRAVARVNQGSYVAAEADYTAAIQRDGDNAGPYYSRGATRYGQGSYAQAEADFTAAIQRGMNDADVFTARGNCRVRLDQLEEAERDCARAAELAPDASGTYGGWGALYLARRRYEDAIEQYQAALQSNDATGWYFELGLAYLLAGRFEEAGVAYGQGVVDEDRTYGLRELDYWVSQQPDRVDSNDAQQCLAGIRALLADKQP